MSEWTKENIGNIIIYKNKAEFGGELKNEKVAVYDINSEVPNTIGFVEYPIKLSSKIGKVGIIKDQQKDSEEYLKNIGDWCLLGKVSINEMGELERIAKASKTPAYEDLSPRCTFQ